MTMTVAHLVTAEAGRDLPMPPWLYGVLALLTFTFMLGVTWSFRGTAHKGASPAAQHETGHGAGAASGPGAAPSAGYQAGHPEPQGDEAHWPEHPGHH